MAWDGLVPKPQILAFDGDYWTRTSDHLRMNSPAKLFFGCFQRFLVISAPIRLFSGRDFLHKIRLLHRLLWYKLWFEPVAAAKVPEGMEKREQFLPACVLVITCGEGLPFERVLLP